MHFTKMHGAGNDFVIINNMSNELQASELPGLAKMLCAYHTGIGADGMMVVVPAVNGGDFKMLFYNNDGTEGEMCGNGARCIARYGYETGLSGTEQHVETISGTVVGLRITEDLYRIRLNDASIAEAYRPSVVDGKSYETGYVELGNPGLPHAILILPGWQQMERGALRELGRKLRYASEFPKGANVSFVEIAAPDQLNAITFERGVEDFTLACGTGCGSIVTVLTLRGLVSGKNVEVNMPGGTLYVSTDCTGALPKDIFLTGPTCIAFEGETKL